MIQYAIKRFGYMVFTLWVIVTLTFILMHMLPGNPFQRDNRKIPETILNNLYVKYGLDKPLHVQYVIYLRNLLKGDLGVSMRSETRTVNEMIAQHFPVSARLGLWALCYAVIGGLVLGVVASLWRNRWPDYGAMVLAVIGVSVPSFVLGTLLQWVLGVQWDRWFGDPLLPVGGWNSFAHMILPSFVLGLGVLAINARMMRSSMLDVMTQDYIKTARAKGLSGAEVVWRHGVRNAVLPIVTIMGPAIVNLTTGSLIIEQVFAIPGLGKYFVQAIINNDYTLIMGTTIFYASLLVIALFLVDIAYVLIDPRIRLVRTRA